MNLNFSKPTKFIFYSSLFSFNVWCKKFSLFSHFLRLWTLQDSLCSNREQELMILRRARGDGKWKICIFAVNFRLDVRWKVKFPQFAEHENFPHFSHLHHSWRSLAVSLVDFTSTFSVIAFTIVGWIPSRSFSSCENLCEKSLKIFGKSSKILKLQLILIPPLHN